MIARSELSFLLKFSFSHAYVSQLPKSYCFTSLWSHPSFGNQCFPVVVSLFNNHGYEITVSSNLAHSSREINQITGSSNFLHCLNFENCENEPYTNGAIFRIVLYCNFFLTVVSGWNIVRPPTKNFKYQVKLFFTIFFP